MINFFKKLLNPGSSLDIEQLIQRGAVIIDVRTEGEFKSAHAKGSINIPLDKLNTRLSKLNKNQPVITCCASGMRSESALNILKKNDFSEVYNAGSWTRINRK